MSSSESEDFVECTIHLLITEKPTYRITYDEQCEICSRPIMGKRKVKWITWNSINNKDPDKMFIDLYSKFLAFTRVRNYSNINLDFNTEQKTFITKINSKMNYWLNNPITKEPEDTEIYIPKYYKPLSYRRSMKRITNRV